MKVLKSIFRVSEWFGSKLPLQIAMLLLFAYASGQDAEDIFVDFLLFVAYSITYFSISYLANDLSDIEDDKRAGKRNAFKDTSVGFGIGAFIVVTVLHFTAVLFISLKWQFILLAIIGYLFGIFYSFKPFRFKERGALGLVVAAFFQRNLQLFVISFMLDVDWLLFALINVASFVYGIRFILIHQYMDLENDEISGTKTFVRSAKNVTKAIIYTCILVELTVVFVGLAIFLSKISFVYVIALGVGYALELLIWLLMRLNHQKDIFTSYTYIPMNFVYLLTIPIIACIAIASASWSVSYWVVLYVLSLSTAFYKTIKFHTEYILGFCEKAHVISCCKKNSRKMVVRGGVRFFNIEPRIEDEIDLEGLDGYVVISPVKVCLDLKELLPYFEERQCVEVRYNVCPEIEKRIEREKNAFQMQNDDMRGFFSVYIFKRPDFDRFQRSAPAKTIALASADCREATFVRAELPSLEVEPSQQLEKEYARHSGLATGELYWRRRMCFMKIFPVFLFFNLLLLTLGTLGYFLVWDLFAFSVVTLSINVIAGIAIWMIQALSQGVKLRWVLLHARGRFGLKINKKRVPFYMVYGIYKDKIVKRATYERVKASILIFGMIVALFLAILVW